MKKTGLLMLILLFAAAALHADCDNPRDDFDDLYCLNKIYIQADKDLNAAYGKLKEKLDDEGKQILKKTQNEWIKLRNSRCSYKDERGFFVNLKCATDITIDRSKFLDDRYRECISAGCLKSRLK